MTDKEKLEKIYDFVQSQEDFFYDKIVEYEVGSVGNMQCMFQATSFQKVRYFIEDLMEL